MLAKPALTVCISSAFVPQPKFGQYLQNVQDSEIPTYEAAAGFVSVSLLQRICVSYVELLVVSMWQSSEALVQFLQSRPTDVPRECCGAIELGTRIYEVAHNICQKRT